MDVNVILIIAISTSIMSTIVMIIALVGFIKLQRRYSGFMSKFEKEDNIEETLRKYIDKVGEINEENKLIKANVKTLERKLTGCSQKVGMVRYNAFEDVGSELSFALAVLDNNLNGYILNAIYGRDSSSIFAKPIEGGTSSYTLSDEEIKALAMAKEK